MAFDPVKPRTYSFSAGNFREAFNEFEARYGHRISWELINWLMLEVVRSVVGCSNGGRPG